MNTAISSALLSGIGLLMGLFNTRLADVSAHIASAARTPQDSRAAHRRARYGNDSWRVGGREHLRRGVVSLCRARRRGAAATGLFLLLGVALICAVGALAAFTADSVLAWHGLHTEGPLPHMGA